jgi:tetratricopeptide (TPR) repeat protein
MGNCLALLGLYTEAIEKYQRAIHIDPSLPREKMDQFLSLQEGGET